MGENSNLSRREVLKYAVLAGSAMLLHAPEALGEDPTKPFTFALVSDNHLGRVAEHDIDNLKAVVREINATDAEFTIFCGDLVHAGQEPKNERHYPTWKRIVGELAKPWYAVPGNHDPDAVFAQQINSKLNFNIDRPPYRFICFRDAKPNPNHDGAVTAEQVQWIQSCIDEAKQHELRVILVAHIIHHANKSPNRGWVILDGRPEFDRLLEKNAGTIAAFFAGHYHFGFLGWQDAPAGAKAKVAQTVLPSTSWNEDHHLKRNVQFIVEDYRAAYVLAEASAQKIVLKYKPIGAAVAGTTELLV